MSGFVNILKLSVGTESVEGLARWQTNPRAQGADGLPRHVTRMWPKRAPEIEGKGSIYWVIKGAVLCRQRILRLDEITRDDGIRRCAMVLDPTLVAVAATPKRPFQGWRYLDPAESPPDLSAPRKNEEALPPELSAALAEIGVI